MPNEPISLVSVHQKKVDNYCLELCQEELTRLEGTKYSDLIPVLQTTWELIADHLGAGNDIYPPTVGVYFNGETVEFQSSLSAIQFSDLSIPYITEEEGYLGNFAVLDKHVGTGEKIAKELILPETQSDEKLKVIEVVFKDIILKLYDQDDVVPITLYAFTLAIISYYIRREWVYVDSFLADFETDVGDEILIVQLTSGIETVELFLIKEIAEDDWDDFCARRKDYLTKSIAKQKENGE